MLRATKIIATCGPATDQGDTLEQLILNRVNVFRLNFSHGKLQDHLLRAQTIRQLAKKHGMFVAILCDLQGPKIRICRFVDGSITLQPGTPFAIDANHPKDQGNKDIVGCDLPTLADDCSVGDLLLVDDGRIQLSITTISGSCVHTTVVVGGTLSNNKGLNKNMGGLNADSITSKDRQDIQAIKAIAPEFLALSFPKSAQDIRDVRRLADEAGYTPQIVAKVERFEAVADNATIDAIIEASDVIMVARGDLGVEIGDGRLIGIQKHLIRRTVELNKSVITATQMMESMVANTIPTRAEVFDVANAVIDGTDAVMLSAETAAGKHPVTVVQAMANICKGAEHEIQTKRAIHKISDMHFDAPNTAIAHACIHHGIAVVKTASDCLFY